MVRVLVGGEGTEGTLVKKQDTGEINLKVLGRSRVRRAWSQSRDQYSEMCFTHYGLRCGSAESCAENARGSPGLPQLACGASELQSVAAISDAAQRRRKVLKVELGG
jgi:hypothetical protein